MVKTPFKKLVFQFMDLLGFSILSLVSSTFRFDEKKNSFAFILYLFWFFLNVFFDPSCRSGRIFFGHKNLTSKTKNQYLKVNSKNNCLFVIWILKTFEPKHGQHKMSQDLKIIFLNHNALMISFIAQRSNYVVRRWKNYLQRVLRDKIAFSYIHLVSKLFLRTLLKSLDFNGFNHTSSQIRWFTLSNKKTHLPYSIRM